MFLKDKDKEDLNTATGTIQAVIFCYAHGPSSTESLDEQMLCHYFILVPLFSWYDFTKTLNSPRARLL